MQTPGIRVITPSYGMSAAKKAEIARTAEKRGIRTAFSSAVPLPAEDDTYRYAADARTCFFDIIDALYDTSCPVLWAARGGAGSTRLYPYFLRYAHLLRNAPPNIIAGYSDVTFLLAALGGYRQFFCIHAPTFSELSRGKDSGDPALLTRVRQALRMLPQGCGNGAFAAAARHISVSPRDIIREPLNRFAENAAPPGDDAVIEGGNLTLIQATAGAAFAVPRASGRYLLLEDVGIRTHDAERALLHLEQTSGGFNGCAGILLGDFAEPEGNNAHNIEVRAALTAHITRLRISAYAVAVGHFHENFSFLLYRPRANC